MFDGITPLLLTRPLDINSFDLTGFLKSDCFSSVKELKNSATTSLIRCVLDLSNDDYELADYQLFSEHVHEWDNNLDAFIKHYVLQHKDEPGFSETKSREKIEELLKKAKKKNWKYHSELLQAIEGNKCQLCVFVLTVDNTIVMDMGFVGECANEGESGIQSVTFLGMPEIREVIKDVISSFKKSPRKAPQLPLKSQVRKPHKFARGCAATFFLLIAIWSAYFLFDAYYFSMRCLTTEGTVEEYKTEMVGSRKRRHPETKIRYHFFVNGIKYEGSDSGNFRTPTGNILVHYLPDNISDNRLSQDIPHMVWISVIFGVVGFVFILKGYVSLKF